MSLAVFESHTTKPGTDRNLPAHPQAPAAEANEPAYPDSLSSWAAFNGLEPETALLLASVLLAQLAGPALDWDGFGGLSGMPAPSILAADSDTLLHRACRQLMAPILTRQEGFLLGSREFRRKDVDEYCFSLKRQSTMTELKRFDSQVTEFGLPSFFDFPPQLLDHRTPAAHFGAGELRREKLLHPLFAMETLPDGPLAKPLSDCHLGQVLMLAVTVRLSAEPPARHRRLDEICRLLEGTELVRSSQAGERPRPARMGGVFLFRQCDLRWMFEHHDESLRRMIPAASGTAILPREDQAEGSDTFRARFENAALQQLSYRRDFALYPFRFSCPATKTRFRMRRAEFIKNTSGDPTNLSMVPDLLMWGLTNLYPNQRPDEAALTELAFHAAVKIREHACHTARVHRELEQSRIHMERATRMLERIAKHGPLKRHELVRGFDNQRMAIHRPVIETLIQRGFLLEGPDKKLSLAENAPAELTRELFLQALP